MPPAPVRAEQLIESLGLRPHPEGGWYAEIFRSPALVRPADGRGARASLTTIYFLLTRGQRSKLHRVTSDELWHFYEGDPLKLSLTDALFETTERVVLGPHSDSARPVHAVPAGMWQAAKPLGDYALVGCTVGPGFDFADFTMLDVDIRPITAEQVRVLRSAWLRPFERPDQLVYGGDDDPNVLHAGAFQDDALIGIASVAPGPMAGSNDPGVWRLRGMAVHPEARDQGVGHRILERCMAHVSAHGGTHLWCNGRASAASFYRSLGFEVTGEEFQVPGTGPHFVMQRRLESGELEKGRSREV